MTTSSSEIRRQLKSRTGNPLYNTSYPLSPGDWAEYTAPGALSFDISQPVAFYVHIPFCRKLCSFCEYTRLLFPSEAIQDLYVKRLRDDICGFINDNPSCQLYGFDIGGGTPTALHDDTFSELIDLYRDITGRVNLSPDFEPSIEGTFETLTERKARIIAGAGIRRISLGLQSSSSAVLNPLNRHTVDADIMRRAIDCAHSSGIEKINLDLMYGLPGQSLDSIREDVETIAGLHPEQVTLYELRTNQLNSGYRPDSYNCYQQYSMLFDELTRLGYHGVFGQNTFSISAEDKGLSSYLRHRMFSGRQYKGFGISAQSMSENGISYNAGKNKSTLTGLLDGASFEADRHYALPPAEIFAKYVAISGYSGGFSLNTARQLYGAGFDSDYRPLIATLEYDGFITIDGDRLQLTRRGFRDYGAVLSMFFSPVKMS